MKASMKKKRGVVGAVVLAGILSVGGYALTNTITFEEAATTAGFGAQSVKQLEVEDIDYTLDGTDKTKITAITFELSTATVTGDNDAQAWIEYMDGTAAGTWTDCGTIAPDAAQVVCDVSLAPVNVRDVGEDGSGTPWAGSEPGTPGTRGVEAPFRLVIAE